jgi:hypothetical protein
MRASENEIVEMSLARSNRFDSISFPGLFILHQAALFSLNIGSAVYFDE